MIIRPASLVLALLLVLGIFGISALPTETKHALHTQGALHPWLHLCGFGLLAFLLLGATQSNLLRLAFLAALLAFGYGTEARESRKDGWPIEQKDVRTDVTGTLFGAALTLLRRGVRTENKHPSQPVDHR